MTFLMGETDNLTTHLNQIDPTGMTKFTHEEEKEGSIPFLDTTIIKKPDGSTKLCINRKPTHTNQCLQFDSHHPLHQKLGVVRTLIDRKDAIVTEEEDKLEKENTITQSLAQCGYPKWIIEKWNGRKTILKPQNRKQRLIWKTKAKVLWSSPTWKAFRKEMPSTRNAFHVGDNHKTFAFVFYISLCFLFWSLRGRHFWKNLQGFKKHAFPLLWSPIARSAISWFIQRTKGILYKQLKPSVKFLAKNAQKRTSVEQASCSKQDSVNIEVKQKRSVQNVSHGHKEKHPAQKFSNRLSLSMSQQEIMS